jgi:hypothetical protein
MIDNTPGNGMTPVQAVWRFLIYFTVLCNIFVALCLSFLLLNSVSSIGHFFTRPSVIAAAALYIFIVGIVYNTVLRGLIQPTGRDRLADELLHVIVPILFVLYWLFLAPKSSLQWKHTFQWLIFPGLYLIYALIRGNIEKFYPYPFIDVNKHGHGTVLLNSVIIMIVLIALGLLFVAIGKKLGKQAAIN